MPRLVVDGLSMSVDGCVAGPAQSMADPIGRGGRRLHEWMFTTRTMRASLGLEGGTTGVDDEAIAEGSGRFGAVIMGRNMFGPVRGPWPDEEWTGWWGDSPPWHAAVYVLTHHARQRVVMQGGTTFHFVTDGIESALRQARDAAGDLDVSLAGGASVVRQYLEADLVDELRLIVVPILLGDGERLFTDGVIAPDEWRCVSHRTSDAATHVCFERTAPGTGAASRS